MRVPAAVPPLTFLGQKHPCVALPLFLTLPLPSLLPLCTHESSDTTNICTTLTGYVNPGAESSFPADIKNTPTTFCQSCEGVQPKKIEKDKVPVIRAAGSEPPDAILRIGQHTGTCQKVLS